MAATNSRWSLSALASLLAVAAVLVVPGHSAAQKAPAAAAPVAKRAPGDELLGEWWTEGNEGRIHFKRDKDGTFVGRTTCCVPAKPSKDRPTQDVNNPNPKQRTRSTMGIILIWKLKYEGDGEYGDGFVYNPRDGKTYRIDMEIIDRDTVEIRGYLGIPLLGQSQTWKRFKPAARAPATAAHR